MRIEGDIPGFEVTVSDEKVVTILKIVTSLQLPPPSLANNTTYYDDIPVTESSRFIYCFLFLLLSSLTPNSVPLYYTFV